MTGWVYMVALLTTIAGVVYGSGPYLAQLLGFEAGTGSTITCALIMLGVALPLNMLGTKVLAMAAIIGFTAELLGALAVGGWLLLTERHNDLSVLFDTKGVEGKGSYLAAFFAAAIIGVYQYYGFEACGDVAEEVPDPTREIPKAMRMTIYIGGAASILVCLSLLLAVKDFGAIINGEDADPVMTILNDVFGTTGTKFVLLVVMLSFLSCTLSLMAAASRLMYSYARDDMIFGSHLLRHFDQVRHVPPYAMIVAATVPPWSCSVGLLGQGAHPIVSFAILGIYLGFQMVVFAALRARLKGWVPSGPFTLGRRGLPITIAALTYGVLTMINVAWPRTPEAPWYDNWVVVLSAVVGIGAGAIYMTIAKPYLRSEATHGDAVPSVSGPRAPKTHRDQSRWPAGPPRRQR